MSALQLDHPAVRERPGYLLTSGTNRMGAFGIDEIRNIGRLNCRWNEITARTIPLLPFTLALVLLGMLIS